MVNKRVPDWLNNSMWSTPTTSTPSLPKSQSQSSPSASSNKRVPNWLNKRVTSSDSSLNEPRASLPLASSIRPESPSPKAVVQSIAASSCRGIMSNEEEKRCHLCAEEMDWTDQLLKKIVFLIDKNHGFRRLKSIAQSTLPNSKSLNP
ncbi:hypothetical protein L2E82_06232 [Cichorium intybus]|uniref:Uncharacterized protein n=1 Tax=Cichorium intybus TaxID=13427 RepID=A0ACB9HAN9_CICIN|nr:hypothetical protein L2E82_06232 [Cichorium intybus]